MKTIHAPYIEKLDHCDISEAAAILDSEGISDVVESVNWFNEFPYKPITFVNIARSQKSVFIRFYVHGIMLKAIYSEDQSPVCEDSCVEFFCKVPENDYYTNFEFNCIGTCAASQRKDRKTDVVRFNPEQMKTIKRFSSIGNRAFNEMEGMFEWELTVEIPFELIGINNDKLPEKLLANFYKCAGKTDSPHYVSWNPVKTEKPDFHRPEFFGEVIF